MECLKTELFLDYKFLDRLLTAQKTAIKHKIELPLVKDLCREGPLNFIVPPPNP